VPYALLYTRIAVCLGEGPFMTFHWGSAAWWYLEQWVGKEEGSRGNMTAMGQFK